MTSTNIFQITAKGLRSNYWSLLRIQNSIPITNVRTAAAAAGGKGGKKGAGQSVGKAKRALSVETNPEKLVNFVCGSDYRTEEHREGDVPIKPDSEYPDWLFTMDITRPKPNAINMKDKTDTTEIIDPILATTFHNINLSG